MGVEEAPRGKILIADGAGSMPDSALERALKYTRDQDLVRQNAVQLEREPKRD